PNDIAGIAREWVLENLSDGVAPQARAMISGRWSNNHGISLDTVIGDMEARGLTIDYLSPMPPAENVSGTARFNKRIFEVDLQSGRLPGLSLESGNVVFTGLDQYDQFMDMDLTVNGSFKSALELMDSEPLGFAKAVDLSPDGVTGQGVARVKLGLLVERATSAEDVKVSATASLEDISIPDIALGHALSGGDLNLKADNDGLTVSGTANFAKVPVALKWQENFQRDVKEKTQISLTADLSADQFRSVTGLETVPFGPAFVAGNLGVGLLVALDQERVGRVVLDVNLLDADLSIPQLDWQKSAKVESAAKILAEFEAEGLTRITSFDLAGGGVKLTGGAVFSKNAVKNVTIDKFLLGGSDVSGVVARQEGGWSVAVRGPRLDISAFLDEDDEAAQAEETGPDLHLTLEIGRLEVSDGNFLRNVSGEMRNNGRVWTNVEALATVEGGKSLAINLSPAGGKRLLSIGAEDAGAVLKSLGYYENIVGGKLAIKAEYADMTPDSIVTGQALIEDFRLVDAPVLARLLSVASITGIPGELAGAGLSFQQFDVPFIQEDGLIRIKDAKAGGFSLGITANGTIDTELGTMDIKGSVAPLDKLNSLLGNIPLFGVFFSAGEKGGGVFAAEYSMTGPFDDPEISTNPLSAFTPGIFRKIFDIFPDRTPAADRWPAKKTGTPK
ncbi:MAG: AsmA-like C-terminal domain-containing protein, partial [Rhodospirillales bacterium]|nr:AsmA-like C-terminal domain-containing protein [Rhodospirillales bacterium]